MLFGYRQRKRGGGGGGVDLRAIFFLKKKTHLLCLLHASAIATMSLDVSR